MAAQMTRARFTISAPTLARFNAAIPSGERSRVVEQCMHLAFQEREKRLEQIATAFMADSASAACLADDAAWDSAAADGLAGV
jgi:hypothetical protein